MQKRGTNLLSVCVLVATSQFAHIDCVTAELVALDNDTLSEVVGQAGVSISIESDFTTSTLSYVDTDGTGGGSAQLDFNEFAMTSDGPIQFDLDITGAYDHDNNSATETKSAFVIDVDDLDAANVLWRFGRAQLENNTNAVGFIEFRGVSLKNTIIHVVGGGASGEGLYLNLDMEFRIDELSIVDSADVNNPGVGTGALGFSGITLNGDYTSANPGGFMMQGLTVDIDGNKGLVIGIPKIQGDLAIESIHAGGESAMGLALRDIDIGGGRLYVSGH